MPDSSVSQQVIVPVPMPLDTACTVEWQVLREPHRGVRGPLGELLQDHVIDLGDLGWIATYAFDPKAKAAALTLLAHQIGQPDTIATSLRYGPEVVAGSEYLADQQSESEMEMALLVGVGGTVVIMLAVEFVGRAFERVLAGNPWPAVLIALLIVLAVVLIPVVLLVGGKVKGASLRAKSFRLGREGEEWAEEKARMLLDSRWVVFRNVHLPRQKADLDFVLVGPSGVWVWEAKTFYVTVRVRDGRWECLKGKGWQHLDRDPVTQVRANAKALRYFLEQQGVMLRVNAAVVLTRPEQVSNFGPTAEPVWKTFEIDDRIREMNALPPSLGDKDRDRIVAALKTFAIDANSKPAGA